MITVHGEIYSKKNSKEIFRNKRTGKSFITSNSNVIKNEKEITSKLLALPNQSAWQKMLSEYFSVNEMHIFNELLRIEAIKKYSRLTSNKELYTKENKKQRAKLIQNWNKQLILELNSISQKSQLATITTYHKCCATLSQKQAIYRMIV